MLLKTVKGKFWFLLYSKRRAKSPDNVIFRVLIRLTTRFMQNEWSYANYALNLKQYQ